MKARSIFIGLLLILLAAGQVSATNQIIFSETADLPPNPITKHTAGTFYADLYVDGYTSYNGVYWRINYPNGELMLDGDYFGSSASPLQIPITITSSMEFGNYGVSFDDGLGNSSTAVIYISGNQSNLIPAATCHISGQILVNSTNTWTHICQFGSDAFPAGNYTVNATGMWTPMGTSNPATWAYYAWEYVTAFNNEGFYLNLAGSEYGFSSSTSFYLPGGILSIDYYEYGIGSDNYGDVTYVLMTNSTSISNPYCIEHCTYIPPESPIPHTCNYNDTCTNPYWETAKAYFTEVGGVIPITSGYLNHTYRYNYIHTNGNYPTYNYTIQIKKSNGSVYTNLSLNSFTQLGGSFDQIFYCCENGTWNYQILKTNSTIGAILSNINFTVEQQPTAIQANLSVFSGYVYNSTGSGIYHALVQGKKINSNGTLIYNLVSYYADPVGHFIVPNLYDGKYTFIASAASYNDSNPLNLTFSGTSIVNQNFNLVCAASNCTNNLPTQTPTPTGTETPFVTPTPGATPTLPTTEEMGVNLFDAILAFLISYAIWMLWVIVKKVH